MNATLQRFVFILTFTCVLPIWTSAQTGWKTRHEAADGALLWSIAEGRDGVVAVGDKGTILHSYDGLNWIRRSSGTSAWLVAVTYGDGKYIAVGDGGTILHSKDAVSWFPIPLTPTSTRLNNVVYGQGRFVAVGEKGLILTSTDGFVWVPCASGVTTWLHGLSFGGRYWVATGQNSTLLTSSDGVIWTRYTQLLPVNADFEAVTVVYSRSRTNAGVISHSSQYQIVGSGGASLIIFLSQEEYTGPNARVGELFVYPFKSMYPTGVTVRLASVTNLDGVLVATGDDGTVITAAGTGGEWRPLYVGTRRLLNAATTALGTVYLAGESEIILQSDRLIASRFANVSTRGHAGSGANAMIAGTVITGNKPKRMLIRGVGPTLGTRFRLSGVLGNPLLTVYNESGAVVGQQTDWRLHPEASVIASESQRVGAFPLDASVDDSAMVLTLHPGAYTIALSSWSGSTGVALVEAYDLDGLVEDAPQAINISTRGMVKTGSDILIAGISIQGSSPKDVLLRAVGPTLADFGVSNPLQDPVITVYRNSGARLAENDDWSASINEVGRSILANEMASVAASVGAFPLRSGSADSSLVLNLPPGNYTVHVSGKNNSTGIALVESYILATPGL